LNYFISAALALFLVTPAFASRHPIEAQTVCIDVAATPSYAIDTPVKAIWHARRHREARHEAPRRARPEIYYTAPSLIQAPVDAAMVALGAILGIPEGWEDGLSAPLPKVIQGRPKRLEGPLTIGDSTYEFASGGHGWSIPLGTVKITPEAVGSWGSRHGAIGLNNDSIYDPQLGRDREGIELHPASHMASAGCVVIDRSRWAEFKRQVLAMIEEAGQAFLHIGPNGAAITPTRVSPLPPVIYIATKEREEPRQRIHYAHRHHVRLAGA
jgi:hypothetical protein